MVKGNLTVTVKFDENFKEDVKKWIKDEFIERTKVKEAIETAYRIQACWGEQDAMKLANDIEKELGL